MVPHLRRSTGAAGAHPPHHELHRRRSTSTSTPTARPTPGKGATSAATARTCPPMPCRPCRYYSHRRAKAQCDSGAVVGGGGAAASAAEQEREGQAVPRAPRQRRRLLASSSRGAPRRGWRWWPGQAPAPPCSGWPPWARAPGLSHPRPPAAATATPLPARLTPFSGPALLMVAPLGAAPDAVVVAGPGS